MPQSKILIKALGFVAVVCFPSCRDKNMIEIDGDIKGLTSQIAYISNNYPTGSKPFDSCKIVNGKFSFKFHPNTVFEPRLVFITYNDRKLPFGVINPYINGKEQKYAAFIMETGATNLTGDLTKSNGLNIKAGRQNEFYFKEINLPFFRISDDSIKHKAQVNRYINKIKAMPDAYWAMFAMSDWKFHVSKNELTAMFNAFDEQTRKSNSGKQIEKFLAEKLDENALKPNDLLTDDKGNKVNLIDTTKKLNMLVFWASWCGPCNLEIPSLKKIAAKYKDPNFRIVSVTIDKDKDQWKQRLSVVNMPWQQLCIDNEILPKVISQYNLGWIPQIFFVDNTGKLIKYVNDYSPANDVVFDKTIGDYLKIN